MPFWQSGICRAGSAAARWLGRPAWAHGRGWHERICNGTGLVRGDVPDIPSFPAETPDADPADDPPIFFLEPPDPAHTHYADMRADLRADMRADGAQLLARRRTGYVMCLTGTGPTVQAAQQASRARARQVVIPGLRWRADIGDRFIAGEGARLTRLGGLESAS